MPVFPLNNALGPEMAPKTLGAVGFHNGPPPELHPETWSVSGITKDAAGAVLPNVTVDLYERTTHTWMGSMISGSDGAFSFNVPDPALGYTYFFVGYLDGGTPVAGTTLQTLVGA